VRGSAAQAGVGRDETPRRARETIQAFVLTCDNTDTCHTGRSGETGRRAGLKIPWGSPPVRVRFPPPAPANSFYPLTIASAGSAVSRMISTREKGCSLMQQSNGCIDRRWTQVHVALRRRQILMAG
jgi:hypothetical protein